MCDTHRKRVARHGTPEQSRPADWGAKEKHPKYKSWCTLRRYHLNNMPQSWVSDFWAFVADTPEKPEGRASIRRMDAKKPWDKSNFYWREPVLSDVKRAEKAAYMRAYSKKMREGNPDYHKSAFLKRKYAISILDYNEMLTAQDGRCAICRKTESNIINGKTLSLAVDHDHKTGAVRALLCSNCNTALGLFGDDPGLLDAAKAYLTKHLATPMEM